MTKEKLEKEAEGYFKSICGDYNEEYERTGKRHYFVGFDIKNAYLAGAEPREKQIQIDAEQIRALQKQNGELTDELTKKADTNHQLVEQMAKLSEKNAELEDKLANADYQLEGRDNEIRKLNEQIEKMKCCGNCQKLRGRFDSKTNINILYCSDSDMKQIEVGFQMCCCKWEIEEK